MNRLVCLGCVLLLTGTVVHGQHKMIDKAKHVKCSGETEQACLSFRQLVDARDPGVVKAISEAPSYVCFRPGVDAFVILELAMPGSFLWKRSSTGGEFQDAAMSAMEEYRDGTLYLYRLGLGEWKRLDEIDSPTYHTMTKPGKGEVFEVNVDANEIVVTHSFENRSNATTRHSLIIRRSTGRFTEHYESQSGNPLDYAGTCQIYQPRE